MNIDSRIQLLGRLDCSNPAWWLYFLQVAFLLPQMLDNNVFSDRIIPTSYCLREEVCFSVVWTGLFTLFLHWELNRQGNSAQRAGLRSWSHFEACLSQKIHWEGWGQSALCLFRSDVFFFFFLLSSSSSLLLLSFFLLPYCCHLVPLFFLFPYRMLWCFKETLSRCSLSICRNLRNQKPDTFQLFQIMIL